MSIVPEDAQLGTVVVSVDAELGWGFHDLTSPPARRVESARSGWIRLLDLFDTYDLPATWAIVGHLFLTDCDGEHVGHPTPAGWFERELGAWSDRPDLRFGNGLIERVENASVDHELANHSFSHVLFGAASTSSTMARAEVTATERAAGRSFDTFVFPRNYVGHRQVLADTGVTSYRGRTTTMSGGSLATSAGKLSRAVAGSGAPLVDPVVDEYGLVNVPASMYLFDFEGLPRAATEFVADDPVVTRACRGVDAASRTGRTLHLWLHPNNIIDDRHHRRLERILEYIATKRDNGSVSVDPMGTVASRVLDERVEQ